MTAPIALIYGSSTCYTEIAAEKIRDLIGPGLVDLYNVADTPLAVLNGYERIILGIPTWDYGELQEDWEHHWDDLEDVDWQGKQVALYGLGDQDGYPQWFQDAMGYLHAKVTSQGARAVAPWPVAGYRFEVSQALTADGQHFVGLALDEDNEFELSDERLAAWVPQVLAAFGLDADSPD